MEEVVIEKLRKEQVEDVFEIQKTFFDVKNIDSICSAFDSDTLSYFVLKNGETIIGYFECSVVLDEAELFEITVKQEYQGKGYSKFLMKFFLDFCKTNGVGTIFLEVNKTNIKAINLYEKFNFQTYSSRKKYYGNNDAILMKYVF